MTLLHDLRYALRLMRRSPGFTAAAVLSLALGIGANTAIFSLLYTVMLRSLPVSHPEQLVEIMDHFPGEPRGLGNFTWTEFESFRDQSRTLTGFTGVSFHNALPVTIGNAERELVVGEYVAGNYFSVLGVKPAIGRAIDAADIPAKGEGNVAVISWSYWARRFDRDPSVLGSRVLVNKDPYTIVGVAPRGYDGPRVGNQTALWVPLAPNNVKILARLKPGATLAQARAEIAVLFQPMLERRIARFPDARARGYTVEVEPAGAGLSRVRDMYGKPLILLMAVVGFLLLLACVNLAGMLLARGVARRREIAVRVSLGAGRARLLRQILSESVLLSTLGAILGVALAWVAAGALGRILSSGRVHERIFLQVTPDLRLALFTAAIAILTGILFGLPPAWYAFRAAPAAHLGRRGPGESRFWKTFGKVLVAAQVALSILLVTATAVFLGHVSRLRNFDLGFRSDHVLLLQLDRPETDRHRLVPVYDEVLARLRALPGVRAAAITGCTPIQGCGAGKLIRAEGFAERPEERRFAALNWISAGYFDTLRIPLLAGRDFAPADAGRSRVAVINRALARHYFPNADPIGKHIVIDRSGPPSAWYGDNSPFEVVGVVGDSKYSELRDDAPPTMFMCTCQEGHLEQQFALRTAGPPEALATAARASVRDVLGAVPIRFVTTLSDQVDAAIVPERLIATLSEFFGVLAAALAGIGLYGLLAYTVGRRTNEIGVRMALGATTADVARLILSDALGMVAAGICAGALLVFWTTPLAKSLLPDLDHPGAAPVTLAALSIAAVALVASYIPTRRAARVSPLDALRHE